MNSRLMLALVGLGYTLLRTCVCFESSLTSILIVSEAVAFLSSVTVKRNRYVPTFRLRISVIAEVDELIVADPARRILSDPGNELIALEIRPDELIDARIESNDIEIITPKRT